jgi:hypothetical protein
MRRSGTGFCLCGGRGVVFLNWIVIFIQIKRLFPVLHLTKRAEKNIKENCFKSVKALKVIAILTAYL